MKKKYMRVQVRYRGKTGKPVGIFGACHHVVFNTYHDFNATDEDRKKFRDAEDWFEEHLPNPPFYEEDGNKNNYITWFKTDSTLHMLEKLQPMMEILDKFSVPYDIIYTDYLEGIVYEDPYQVAVDRYEISGD